MMNDYMVYDRRMINGEWRVMVEPYNLSKIIQLEKTHGTHSVKNIQIWTKKRAFQEWEERTGGLVIDTMYSTTKKETKKVPQHLRKAGNTHKLMEWKVKNNIA